MRTLVFSVFTAIAFLTIPAFAVPLTCNTAVQNWQNGSQKTCPYGAGNFVQSDPAPPPRAPTREVPQDEVPE